MAVFKFLAICFVGYASACSTRSARMPNVESGQVDIPIRLNFQKGPIPSASVQVGLESRMNQHLGDGVYRQHRFNSGFNAQAGAVPTFDHEGNVNGMQADIDTGMSHHKQTVYLNGNPLDPNVDAHASLDEALQEREEDGAYDRTAFIRQQEQIRDQKERLEQAEAQAEANPSPEASLQIQRLEDQLKRMSAAIAQSQNKLVEAKRENLIAGMKVEHFAGIMVGIGAIVIGLAALLFVLMRRQKQAVQPIQVVTEPKRHRPHSHKAVSVYTASISPLDSKPPSYSGDSIKSEKF